MDEVNAVKAFIAERSQSQELSEQLHVIWYGDHDSMPKETLTSSITGIASLRTPTDHYWRPRSISLMNVVTEKVRVTIFLLYDEYSKTDDIIFKYPSLPYSPNLTASSPWHMASFGKS